MRFVPFLRVLLNYVSVVGRTKMATNFSKSTYDVCCKMQIRGNKKVLIGPAMYHAKQQYVT